MPFRDDFLAVGILLFFGLLIYAKQSGKSFKEIFLEIRDVFGGG